MYRKTDSLALLLGYGAGIYELEDGSVKIDAAHNPLAPSKRAHAIRAMRLLADEILASEKTCDYIAVFEDCSASSVLAQLLAVTLSQTWQRRIPVLIISRPKKWQITFKIYLPGRSGQRSSMHLLTGTEGQRRVRKLLSSRRRRALIFTRAIEHDDRNPTLHMLRSAMARRHGITLVGLATLAVIHRGARRRMKAVVGNRKFPIWFLHHFGKKPRSSSSTYRTHQGFMSAIRRLLSVGSTAPKTG